MRVSTHMYGNLRGDRNMYDFHCCHIGLPAKSQPGSTKSHLSADDIGIIVAKPPAANGAPGGPSVDLHSSYTWEGGGCQPQRGLWPKNIIGWVTKVITKRLIHTAMTCVAFYNIYDYTCSNNLYIYIIQVGLIVCSRYLYGTKRHQTFTE